MPKPKPGARMGAPRTAQAKITDYGLDAMCEAITDGRTIQAIVAEIGVSRMAWARWIADPEHPDRKVAVDAARIAAAAAEDDLALGVLQDLPDDPSPGQVSKAREVANHRRWRAARMDPATYGDRHQVDLNAKVENLNPGALDAEIAALVGPTSQPDA